MVAGQALPYTHLSLQQFGRLLGVNPVHMMGGVTSTVFPILNNSCQELLTRYSWQNLDAVSHEEILLSIEQAERDIADFLGYWVAPQWTSQEIRQITRPYRPEYFRRYMADVRGMPVGINLNKGKIIQAGQRAVDTTDPGTATVAGGTLVYTDADLDQLFETATITLPTTLTNVCEIKVYYPGYAGDPRYEIRPVRSKTLTGGNVVIVIDSWNMILMSLLEAYPTVAGWQGINLGTNNSTPFIQSVDVFREYTAATSASATFYWEPTPRMLDVICANCGGAGCPICSYTTQDGCLLPRDPEEGIAIVAPGTYSVTDAAWSRVGFSINRDPDFVKVYYYSGNIAENALSGGGCTVLDPRLAMAIMWMAVARLDRPVCQCANPTALWRKYSQDLAFSGEGGSFQINFDDLKNPFGTKMGEIMAWRALSRTSTPRRAAKVALL